MDLGILHISHEGSFHVSPTLACIIDKRVEERRGGGKEEKRGREKRRRCIHTIAILQTRQAVVLPPHFSHE